MDGIFLLYVILAAVGSLASEYVKGMNHAGKHYSN